MTKQTTSTREAAVEMVNVYEAKSQLSRLIDRAAAGEDVVIARSGRPVSRLTRLETEKRVVMFGALAGEVHILDDFDEPLPEEVMRGFEGC